MRTLFSALAATLLLAGCIEYSEELWLERDLSGKMTFTLGIAEDLATMGEGMHERSDFSDAELKARLEKTPGVRLLEARTYTENELRKFEYTVEFDSLPVLEVLRQDKEADMVGDISLVTLPGGELEFIRSVSFGNSGQMEADEDENNPMGAAMMQMMFGKFTWKYTVHFPYEIASTNAENVDLATNTVTWQKSLASLAEGPVDMKATLRPERSLQPLLMAAVIGALGIVLLLTLLAFLMTRKKKTPTDMAREYETGL